MEIDMEIFETKFGRVQAKEVSLIVDGIENLYTGIEFLFPDGTKIFKPYLSLLDIKEDENYIDQIEYMYQN